mmetsp:Transcript_21685/g.60972  ORF Transcript_21685/g.60972 Transcript_21685/m.60972 type:complete len:138 (-) Transcript_21685:74-487(-)
MLGLEGATREAAAAAAGPEGLAALLADELRALGAGRPFSLVYFDACARLPPRADKALLGRLAESLPAGALTRLQALYVVHPGPAVRPWLRGLRRVWGAGGAQKVRYLASLGDLFAWVPDPALKGDVPPHVWDHNSGA